MADSNWHPISTAPLDRDLEVAVIDKSDIHALAFSCRRVPTGWVDATSRRRIDIDPTHWREWRTGQHKI